MFPVATKFCELVICFVFTDACVTNTTVSVLMNATLSGKRCANVKRDEPASMANESLVKQPHCSALGIHCTFPSLKS